MWGLITKGFGGFCGEAIEDIALKQTANAYDRSDILSGELVGTSSADSNSRGCFNSFSHTSFAGTRNGFTYSSFIGALLRKSAGAPRDFGGTGAAGGTRTKPAEPLPRAQRGQRVT